MNSVYPLHSTLTQYVRYISPFIINTGFLISPLLTREYILSIENSNFTQLNIALYVNVPVVVLLYLDIILRAEAIVYFSKTREIHG